MSEMDVIPQSSEPPVALPPQPNKVREILKGVGLIYLIHCGWLVFPFAYIALGLTQLIYVIPLSYHYKKLGRTGMQQGIWIAAVITFLLNATCFGLIFKDGFRLH
jgi:hypothetical protein